MAIRPITDSKGNLVIKGALVGSQVWDAEFAVILVLKLEQFEKALPIIGPPPPGWDPIMPADNPMREDSVTETREVDVLEELHETKPTVHMLQIAIPFSEAKKLGWSLMEVAQQILQAKPIGPPN
jgi:hypothetical protein